MKKTLRRGLVSLLVLAMALAPVGAFVDEDSIVLKDAVATTQELGIFSGREDGSFDPHALLTRGELGKIYHAFITEGDEEKSQRMRDNVDFLSPDAVFWGEFSDVKSHWARDYILLCDNFYYLFDYVGDSFCPDKEVTAYELCKTMLYLMGYHEELNDLADESITMALIEEYELMVDVPEAVTEPVSRQSAALIISNALGCTTVMNEYILGSVDGVLVSHIECVPQTRSLEETYFPKEVEAETESEM